MRHQSTFSTPLGSMICVADGNHVFSLFFEDCLQSPFPFPQKQSFLLQETEHQLRQYFEGTLHRFSLPLMCEGTDFQKHVWNTLATIPYGHTWSYKAQAEAMCSQGVRAVGTANGKNPLAIIIPCHRVIGASGGWGGYRGGLHRKKWLVQHEKSLSSEIEE